MCVDIIGVQACVKWRASSLPRFCFWRDRVLGQAFLKPLGSWRWSRTHYISTFQGKEWTRTLRFTIFKIDFSFFKQTLRQNSFLLLRLYLCFSFPFSFSKPSHIPSIFQALMLYFKFIASFLKLFLHVCINACICIPKYNLFSLYNVT